METWLHKYLSLFYFILFYFILLGPLSIFFFCFCVCSSLFLAASLLHRNIDMGGMMIKTWSIYKGIWLAEKGILWGIFLVFSLSVRVEHFWWI
jgi:hypothetical protein